MSAADFWNEKYQSAEYIFGKQANDFIRAVTPPARPQQTAYAPADGEGRNGVYLAAQGYQVTSTDIADLAVAKAEALAAEHQLPIKALVGDALNPPFEEESFDLIAVCFMHFRPADNQLFMEVNQRLLKPGGLFILEGYTRDQIALKSGGPRDPEMMFSAKGLREIFAGYDLQLLQEVRRHLNEGPRHQGEAATVQLLARKPAWPATGRKS